MAEPEWPYKVEPFQCHRCGNCCRGDGFVDMSADDLARAAALLGRSPEQFLAEFCAAGLVAGLRHAAGLPPPTRRTISILSG